MTDAREIIAHHLCEMAAQGLSGISPFERAVLPEGLTPSRLYVNGTVRSWLHYLEVRLDPTTQKEHRELAAEISDVVQGVLK